MGSCARRTDQCDPAACAIAPDRKLACDNRRDNGATSTGALASAWQLGRRFGAPQCFLLLSQTPQSDMAPTDSHAQRASPRNLVVNGDCHRLEHCAAGVRQILRSRRTDAGLGSGHDDDGSRRIRTVGRATCHGILPFGAGHVGVRDGVEPAPAPGGWCRRVVLDRADRRRAFCRPYIRHP